MSTSIKESFSALNKYLEDQSIEDRFKGYDPFDGLNSKVFQNTFFSGSRISRLLWVQFFKKSPINFRSLFKVDKDYNAQGIAIFLSSYCILYRHFKKQEYLDIIIFLIKILSQLKIEGYSGACWGYNFDWQARAFFQPKSTPMIVPTAFCVNAILDAYELLHDEDLLLLAGSASDFVLNDLNKTWEEDNFAFSYSPLDSTVVFNASLLASQILSRNHHYSANPELIVQAKKSVQFCLKYQQLDGAWTYGTKPIHQWIDNFHTGYNLVCLSDYSDYSNDHSIDGAIDQGFEYYIKTFFDSDGRFKYYSNKLYPIDINNPAQLAITANQLERWNKNRDLINNVLLWTVQNMQHRKGYFYYQNWKYYKIKIPYLRWSQAWMFYALSIYLTHEED